MRTPFLALLGLALLLGATPPPASAQPCAVGVPDCCGADLDCDDADLCNGGETCEITTGTCLAGADPVVCDDANACTSDACVPATGLCDFIPVADTTPCDDADACTHTDTCQGGTCVGGDPLVCDDLDPCTDDACDPVQGRCVAPPASNGTPCNDQNACTQTDSCQGGVCTGANPIVCDDDDLCTIDACVPTTGACSFVPDEDGGACDDGDLCSQVDVCQGGVCTGTQPVLCDDANPCTTDACVPATGTCGHDPVADTTPCDDGNGCTQSDACTNGTCIGGPPLVCDDGAACTTDACVAGVCVFTPVDGACADGECFQGLCRPDEPGADGEGCVPFPIRTGQPCADDGAACTDDLCGAGLCIHMPVPTRCALADPCSMAACAPGDPGADAAGCVQSPALPDGATCTEDLDPCTRDRCATGTCVHETVDDLDACLPVQDPFRQALVLAAFARSLRAEIAAAPGLFETRRLALVIHADRLVTGLEATAGELAGADPAADSAKARAGGALRALKRLPRDAKQLLRLVTLAGKRDPLDPLDAERLRRGAADLRLGVRELKRDVRRLRRALRRFVQ